MQLERYLGWNRLGLGVVEPDIVNDGFNKGALSELVGSISKLADVDPNIVSWMALVFDIESQILNFLDNGLKLRIIVPYENAVVYIDHENDVITEEYTVVN